MTFSPGFACQAARAMPAHGTAANEIATTGGVPYAIARSFAVVVALLVPSTTAPGGKPSSGGVTTPSWIWRGAVLVVLKRGK